MNKKEAKSNYSTDSDETGEYLGDEEPYTEGAEGEYQGDEEPDLEESTTP